MWRSKDSVFHYNNNSHLVREGGGSVCKPDEYDWLRHALIVFHDLKLSQFTYAEGEGVWDGNTKKPFIWRRLLSSSTLKLDRVVLRHGCMAKAESLVHCIKSHTRSAASPEQKEPQMIPLQEGKFPIVPNNHIFVLLNITAM